jgi:hypothetical protein
MGLAARWLPTASEDSFPPLFARLYRGIAGSHQIEGATMQ